MEKTNETGIKKVVFWPQHIGQNVTYVTRCDGLQKGVITGFKETESYPVEVQLDNGDHLTFTKKGLLHNGDIHRSLFVGHNVKITVEEEELPEVLLCPVCGVEHTPEQDTRDELWSFEDAYKKCPFFYAEFNGKDHAITAMRNLIKAMS